MNNCYIKLLDTIQAECEKQDTCIECKFRSLCEEMEIALEEIEAQDD